MKHDPELFETLERLIDKGDAPAIDAILQDRPDAAETYLTLCQLKSDLGLASALEPSQMVKAETGARFRDRAPVPAAVVCGLAGGAIAAAIAIFIVFSGKTEPEPTIATAEETRSAPVIPKLSPEDFYAQTNKHPEMTKNGNAKITGGIPEETPVINLPEEISFNRHVRSILSENCFHCHGPDGNERKADLRLDTREGALAALTPGDAKNSELVARLFTHEADDLMPPPESGRFLNEEQRLILEKWINQGAEYQEHWAFVDVIKEEAPKLDKFEELVENSIDRFVLARLEEENLTPSPEAEKATLIRRLSLDLTGLAPTAEDVRTFVEDDSAGAYEALVDRLLASPHYGENMALPWLDAARYADSNGFQGDGDRHSYVWRDWVVNAMNANMPFDQFAIEQLAGDLLENPTQDQIIATAFNRNHVLNGEGGAIKEEQRNNYVFDRVDATATTFLGLTMACAQCHDHKFDQLSHKEYFQFFAYFNNLPETGGVDTRNGRIQFAKPTLVIASDEQKAEEAELVVKLNAQRKIISDNNLPIGLAAKAQWNVGIPKDQLDDRLVRVAHLDFDELDDANTTYYRVFFLRKLTDNTEWKAAQAGVDKFTTALNNVRAEMATLMVMEERADVRPTHILDRGDYESPLEKVEPNIPAALHDLPEDAPKNRLGLANWIVDPANPLTPRVIVNRYWQHFFGIGIVKTAEDFGVQSEPPTHPALLDWLAAEFVESGWDVKHMHKLIVMSHTYRQSSRARPEIQKDDPENRLLTRSSRFRLPSMVIRDQALQLAGLLKTEIGGKPVYPYQPDGLWFDFSLEKFKYEQDHGDKLYRRSLYTFWRRTVGPPNLFDVANRQVCMVKSKRTNTPLHALITLNDPTFVEAARVWAERIIKSDSATPIESAFLEATGRQPTAEESSILAGALDKAKAHFQSHPEQASEIFAAGEYPRDDTLEAQEVASWTQVAQLILNLDEVLTRE